MPRQTRPLVAGRFQYRQPLKVRPFWREQELSRFKMRLATEWAARNEAACMASVGKTFIAVEPDHVVLRGAPVTLADRNSTEQPVDRRPHLGAQPPRIDIRVTVNSVRSGDAIGSQPVDDGA